MTTTKRDEASTPGPWQIAWCGQDEPSMTIVFGDVAIAHVVSPRRNGYDSKRVPTQAVAERNARLIAAAPTLLAALKQCLSVMEADYRDNHVCQATRRAIARAEGGDK